MYITTSDNAMLLLKLFNEAQQNISSEDIKAKVKEIYWNENFSDEKKIRKIQAEMDKAQRRGFWIGVASGASAVVGGFLLAESFKKFFKE